jgi:hypothetical protein
MMALDARIDGEMYIRASKIKQSGRNGALTGDPGKMEKTREQERTDARQHSRSNF